MSLKQSTAFIKGRWILGIFFILSVIVLVSCYYDSEDSLFPYEALTNCDTSKYTYAADIKPMIDQNCLSCHANSNSTSLKSYNDIASNADKILGAISHKSGYLAMPQGSAMLPDCNITQFRKWMESGKLNN